MATAIPAAIALLLKFGFNGLIFPTVPTPPASNASAGGLLYIALVRTLKTGTTREKQDQRGVLTRLRHVTHGYGYSTAGQQSSGSCRIPRSCDFDQFSRMVSLTSFCGGYQSDHGVPLTSEIAAIREDTNTVHNTIHSKVARHDCSTLLPHHPLPG